MKNLNLIRRFIIGSMILGLTVPMTYHVTLNILRYVEFSRFTKEVCKAIEPRIQISAQRDSLDYLIGAVKGKESKALPKVEFKDHGSLISPPIENKESLNRETCKFQGITGVEVSIYYEKVSVLNFFYVYLYLIAVPVIFFTCLLARRGVIRLQKKIADRIEVQVKQLFGMTVISDPQKTSLFYKLFDLEIPLLKYLKTHIERLESDLKEYSQKIADQQKREVLMDVAAQMAHEIVTPISNLQVILQSDEDHKNQELILMELTQIKNLSEHILREYRGESQKIKSKIEKIDVVAEINLVIESIKVFSRRKKSLEINFIYDNLEIYEISGERTQFIAAISNILRNSVEAISKKDGLINIHLIKESGSLKIEISDNGSGIKQENLSKIFESKVSIGKKNGTGLGLTQVKSAIEAMGGKVELRSTLGSGTIVSLHIPNNSRIESTANLKFDAFSKPDLILIDDKKSNHIAWDIQARRVKKNLIALKSEQEFLMFADQFDKSTPVYVDYLFENETFTGRKVAENIISLGFKNVHIATGLPPNKIIPPVGIKSVVSKDFPALDFI